MKSSSLLLSLLLLAACSSTPLRPVAFSAPEGFSAQEVEVAILDALSDSTGQGGRKGEWSFDGKQPGVAFARFRYDYFTMRAAVRYTGTDITLEVLESHGLDQKSTSIHSQAYIWLDGLEARIKQRFGRVARGHAKLSEN